MHVQGEGEGEGGLNMTHTIHKLQFGTPVKQLQHPLDGAPAQFLH